MTDVYLFRISVFVTRETRERWLLPTVETEVNGSGEEYKWLVRWACRAGSSGLCSVLGLAACSSRPTVQNIFSLTIHYFNSFAPMEQQAGSAVS